MIVVFKSSGFIKNIRIIILNSFPIFLSSCARSFFTLEDFEVRIETRTSIVLIRVMTVLSVPLGVRCMNVVCFQLQYWVLPVRIIVSGVVRVVFVIALNVPVITHLSILLNLSVLFHQDLLIAIVRQSISLGWRWLITEILIIVFSIEIDIFGLLVFVSVVVNKVVRWRENMFIIWIVL
jgi:hypothetical protein